MNATYQLDLDAPVETVFRYLDDDALLPLWMEGLEGTAYPEGYDPADPVGTRFTQRIREGRRVNTYEGVITSYEAPYHLALRLGNRHFTVAVDYRLRPTLTGTRLDYAARMVSASWATRVLARLFAGFTRRLLDRHMANLKALAEDEAAAQRRTPAAVAA